MSGSRGPGNIVATSASARHADRANLRPYLLVRNRPRTPIFGTAFHIPRPSQSTASCPAVPIDMQRGLFGRSGRIHGDAPGRLAHMRLRVAFFFIGPAHSRRVEQGRGKTRNAPFALSASPQHDNLRPCRTMTFRDRWCCTSCLPHRHTSWWTCCMHARPMTGGRANLEPSCREPGRARSCERADNLGMGGRGRAIEGIPRCTFARVSREAPERASQAVSTSRPE